MLLFKVFLKKISIIIASLLSLFLFLVLIIIILLTSYPKHGIAVIDKLFIHSYELSFQDIQRLFFQKIFIAMQKVAASQGLSHAYIVN